MSQQELIVRQVRALGVAEPLQVTAETVRVVLGAFTRKVLSEETCNGYMAMAHPPLAILMDGLKAFSLDQSGLSHRVQGTIELAIGVLRTRLDRPDIGPLEAREIRAEILGLVREAREEANEQRIITVGLAAFATTALVAVAGGVMAALSERRSATANPLAKTLGAVVIPLLKGK